MGLWELLIHQLFLNQYVPTSSVSVSDNGERPNQDVDLFSRPICPSYRALYHCSSYLLLFRDVSYRSDDLKCAGSGARNVRATYAGT